MKILNPLLGRHALAVTPIRRGGATGRVGEFGKTRVNADGSPKLHKGIDLLCADAWPVFAAHAGVVTRAGWEDPEDDPNDPKDGPRQGYGLRVWIAAADGSVKTVYAHLSKILVTTGQPVQAGDLIGLAGRTGNISSDTPTHLHFEVHAPDPQDPAPMLVEA